MAENQIDLNIVGMHCASCVARIENALKAVDGVGDVSVNLATNRAHVVGMQTAPLDTVRLIGAIERAGYGAHAISRSPPASKPAHGPDGLGELIAAALLSAPILAIGMSRLSTIAGAQWVLAGLSAVVVFGFGRAIFGGALKALRYGGATMDSLIALGSGAAYLFSLWQLIGGHAQTYFETASTIVTFILLGRFLEARAKAKAASSIQSLIEIAPQSAHLVLLGGIERDVDIAKVKAGDLVRIRPGERIPVDGVVVDGQSEVDESLVTGEAIPVLRSAGERVVSGSINTVGTMIVRTEAAGDEAFLGRMTRAVERAQSSKAPVQRLADRISAVFVPVVIAIAVATFAVWHFALHATFASALTNAVAVLVIACPCALGLATPTAIMVASGSAARLGALVRDAATFEIANRIGRVYFDKTGTITTGKPVVGDVIPLGDTSTDEVYRIAASVEASSEHPLARAIVSAAESAGITAAKASNFSAMPGKGASAIVDGIPCKVGSISFASEGLDVPSELSAAVERLELDGKTAIVVSTADRVLGIIGLTDQIRPEAATAIAGLRRMGIEPAMLTGDNEVVAKRIAAEAGIADVTAVLRPEGKADVVTGSRGAGIVTAMVGDGINDAPVLAVADVGIAMGQGSGAAIEAAGITLLRDDLAVVPQVIRLARRTMSIIRGNLFWAFFFNAVGIPLAACGKLSPMISALAMALSSVAVVTNSLRLRSTR